MTLHTISSQKPGQEFPLMRNKQCSVTLKSPCCKGGWVSPHQSHRHINPLQGHRPQLCMSMQRPTLPRLGDGHVTPPGAEKDLKLWPPFLIDLPHCKTTGSPSSSALGIPSPPAWHITNRWKKWSLNPHHHQNSIFFFFFKQGTSM